MTTAIDHPPLRYDRHGAYWKHDHPRGRLRLTQRCWMRVTMSPEWGVGTSNPTRFKVRFLSYSPPADYRPTP